jgi:hypothetical protein
LLMSVLVLLLLLLLFEVVVVVVVVVFVVVVVVVGAQRMHRGRSLGDPLLCDEVSLSHARRQRADPWMVTENHRAPTTTLIKVVVAFR